MMEEDLRELVCSYMPRCDWIKWAAFDKPDQNGRAKLSFYQSKPEIRSDFWFANTGRMASVTVLSLNFDWRETLVEVSLNMTDEMRTEDKLRQEISEIEDILNQKKRELFSIMKRKAGYE